MSAPESTKIAGVVVKALSVLSWICIALSAITFLAGEMIGGLVFLGFGIAGIAYVATLKNR